MKVKYRTGENDDPEFDKEVYDARLEGLKLIYISMALWCTARKVVSVRFSFVDFVNDLL